MVTYRYGLKHLSTFVTSHKLIIMLIISTPFHPSLGIFSMALLLVFFDADRLQGYMFYVTFVKHVFKF